MRDDSELLSAWHSGDRQAGNLLLQRHFESLYRFFASKIDNDAAAEDLIQNTLFACVRYIDKLAEAASFRAYLFTIASNQLYAYIRRHVREGEHIDFTVASAIDLGLSPSAVVARRERDQLLSLALRSLPLELQLILELGYWEGLSATEIAGVLEAPLGTVKSKIRRAKQLLAHELERLGRAPLPNLDDPDADPDASDDLDGWVRQMRAMFDDRSS